MKIYNYPDGRKKININGKIYILQNGWISDIKQLVKKYFKKYKLIVRYNIFQLFLTKEDIPKIKSFEKEIKKIKMKIKAKFYYDIYYF